jgi:Cof subfamily protein (haloacid dehalogenase superfamily)
MTIDERHTEFSPAATTAEKPAAGRRASHARPIGLVAIDLDGTLLNDSKRISEQTAMAMVGLPARGVRVVIASARPPRSVRHIYAALGLNTWTINYNGALIYDPVHDQIVHHQPMDCEAVWDVIDRARGLYKDCLVSCEILDKWYTDKHVEAYTTETGRLFRPNEVAPLEAFCNQPITKLLLLGARPMIDLLEPVLRDEFPGVRVLRSDPELIQIMHADASKAAALRMAAEFYRVPMERVMAIGDAVNDIPMLEAAGVAIAMDNAHPAVKQIADWVAPSNNDHGVHAALVRYGLA